MPHILKNKNLEILIDLPHENYRETRFDWSGKIIEVNFENVTFGITETPKAAHQHHNGRGFFNEFGIDSPLGFDEAKKGEWFHKIGVGLLKKEDDSYSFVNNYKVKTLNFSIQKSTDSIHLECSSELVHGYQYILKKEIQLLETGFRINYWLENIGDKTIKTTEYNHNFLAFNKESMSNDYRLVLPFELDSGQFDENVNPENFVQFKNDQLGFSKTPNEVFFFNYLNGKKKVPASWKLENSKLNIGIKEVGDFNTSKVNVWGCKHVISPELFFEIALHPKQRVSWSRTYTFYKL